MRKLSLRHFADHFLVTGPDTEPAKFKTRQQALDWAPCTIRIYRSEKIDAAANECLLRSPH
jgi:hypothetical protein